MPVTKYTLYTVILLLITTIVLAADDIPRRAAFGANFSPTTPQAAKNAGLESPTGVLIQNVIPNQTASAAGIMPGDILTEMNGELLSSPADLATKWGQYWSGDALVFTVYRGTEKKALEATAVPRPYEQSTDNVEVIYSHAPYLEGHLRTIITKPAEGDGPFPALLLIQGYQCYSLDNLNPAHPYMKWSYMLAEKGYVVMRVDKPGSGDSTAGGPCFGNDIVTETNGFMAGFDSLKEMEFVDPENIFIFGHSMGGISGPIIASQRDVKGLIVYGTTNLTWAEYLIDMFRFQGPRLGKDHVIIGNDIANLLKIVTEHYVNKKSPKEIVEEYPELDADVRQSLGWDGDTGVLNRHYRYWQSINDININKYWTNLGDTYVLSVYGEADIQAINPIAHKEIAEIVNLTNPGKGTFYLLPETDHSFLKLGSMEEGIQIFKSGQLGQYFATSFNTEFVDYVDNWMKDKITKH